MSALLQPKEVEVELPDGSTKTYVISKFPATVGREICTQYPLSAVPKIGEYGRNAELGEQLMCYVGVPGIGAGGEPLMLKSTALINNHVPDFETLIRIEFIMMEYNCSFFARGKASNYFEMLVAKVQVLVMKMLTDFSAQSSKKDTRH